MNNMEYPERIIVNEKSGESPLAMAAMMNGGMNGQWNNPFIYLVWMMFAQRMWGNGYGADGGNNSQIAALQNLMQDNQNSNMIMDAIKGNNAAIGQLSTSLGCDFNNLNAAICDVRNSIQQVGGQVGFSAERVINAVNMGDCRVTEAINACCCNTQKELIRMLGELRLSNCELTNTLSNGLTELRVAIDKGIAAAAFETQRQTCDIVNNSNANTQRIIDTLNGHWNNELQSRLQDQKFETSQLKQNIYIADLINGGLYHGGGFTPKK